MKKNRKAKPGAEDCVHSKGGRCSKHGEGAALKWRVIRKTMVGEGGEMIVEKEREYFYVCDLGLDGTRLRQPRLSFNRATSNSQNPGTNR